MMVASSYTLLCACSLVARSYVIVIVLFSDLNVDVVCTVLEDVGFDPKRWQRLGKYTLYFIDTVITMLANIPKHNLRCRCKNSKQLLLCSYGTPTFVDKLKHVCNTTVYIYV